MIVVLMGPSGAGKSTVGKLLSSALAWDFVDADDFHSSENVDRMHSGTPLTDEDREFWLEALSRTVSEAADKDRPLVLACSALRSDYRVRLARGVPADQLVFAYLDADRAVLEQRLAGRTGHFFPASLLDSQFSALEPPGTDEPAKIFAVKADQTPEQVVSAIVRILGHY